MAIKPIAVGQDKSEVGNRVASPLFTDCIAKAGYFTRRHREYEGVCVGVWVREYVGAWKRIILWTVYCGL